MVREYIGARYVPKFMGVFDITQEYEALCVVDNGQGTSYISKIPTPAGTPLTNTTCWTIYGASSGAIINLQDQINDMKDGAIQGSLQNQITDNANDIAQLTSDTNNMFKDLHSVDVSNMANRIFVFVGDSYTQVPLPTTSFVGKVVNNLGLTSDRYHNIGVSGQGLDGYKLQIDNYAYTDADDVTDVVITGGINDAHTDISDATTIMSKIDALYISAVAKFPKATIWAGFSGGGYYINLSGSYPGFNYDNVSFLKYIWMSRWSTKPKCIYMDNLDIWARTLSDTDYYLTGGNGLHPYRLGIESMATSISNYLKGGANALNDLTPVGCPFVQYSSLSITTWDMPSVITITKKGKYTDIDVSFGRIEFNTPYSLSKNNGMTLGSMVIAQNNEQNATYFNKILKVPSTIYISDNANPTTFIAVPVVVQFAGKYVSIDAFSLDTTISVKHLKFNGVHVSVPSDMLL